MSWEESRVGRRASITSFPRLKGAGQWGTPGRLTWPKAAGYLDRFECQELKRDRENRWRWTKGVTLRKKKKSIATLLFSVFGVVSRLLAAVDLLKPTSSINKNRLDSIVSPELSNFQSLEQTRVKRRVIPRNYSGDATRYVTEEQKSVQARCAWHCKYLLIFNVRH